MKNFLQDKDSRHRWADAKLNEAIAAQIKALRESRGLTQKEFAEKIGTRQPVISQYENPKYSRWSLLILKKIAGAFDVALVVRFVSWGEFVEWILTISAKGVEFVPSFPDDATFGRK